MNCEKVAESLMRDLQKFIGDKAAIIGLSGGIDSSLIAYLLNRSIAKDKIIGVVLPYGDQDSSDGKLVASELGIRCDEINIKPTVDTMVEEGDTDLTKGNMMARVRMIRLYKLANANNGFVIGTTNATEALIGYYTKYGDGAVDVEPIANLYKTEVWELSEYLGVPEKIIKRPPSAELWDGQTDEDELGITYPELDSMLQDLISNSIDIDDKLFFKDKLMQKQASAMSKKYGKEKMINVLGRVSGSDHKRKMPPAFEVEK